MEQLVELTTAVHVIMLLQKQQLLQENLKTHKRFFKRNCYIYENNKRKTTNYYVKLYLLGQQMNVDPGFLMK